MRTRALEVNEVCERLHICRHTVYFLIRSGSLPAVKIGTRWRVKPEDVEKVMQHGGAAGGRGGGDEASEAGKAAA